MMLVNSTIIKYLVAVEFDVMADKFNILAGTYGTNSSKKSKRS
jgi:hypothetical protein